MKKIFLFVSVIMLVSFVGSIPVYDIKGKGFYIDKEGNKFEGKIKYFYARTDVSSSIVFFDKKKTRVVPYQDLASFTINDIDYIPIDSIKFEINRVKKAKGVYTMKNVYLERRAEGKINYYVLRTLLITGKDHWNWDALFLEKNGQLIDLEECSEGKSRKPCILDIMKDNPKIYQKWQKKIKYTIPHVSNIQGYFKEYNLQYE